MLFTPATESLAQDDLEMKEPSNWSHFIDVRLESGYRDNPTYTSSNPSGTTFGTIKLDHTLIRLPVDAWQVTVLTTVDATRLFDSDLAKHELFTFGLFQLQKESAPGRSWEAGLQHIYQDQTIDASTTILNQGSVNIHGHTLQGYGRWKQQWVTGWWIALKPMLEWQTVEQPLDDSYEPGISFSLGQDASKRTSYSLTYDYQERVFDRMTPTDEFGIAVLGDELRFRQHHVEASARWELDEAKVWRLTARAGWRRITDNGQDYFDHDRGRMALELRFRRKHWEIKLSSRASYYDYDIQKIAGAGSNEREKLLLLTGLQAKRNFNNGCYLILRGEHEQSLSNLTTDRYVANTASIGIGWEN